MNRKIALILFVSVASNACSQSSNQGTALEQGSKSDNTKLTELVQAVLESPGIVKFSKADLIRDKYGKIYILFDDNVPRPNSSIYQKGFVLEEVDHKVTNDTPCYVFKKIDIQEKTAYVSLDFGISGFFCYGNLNFVNGEWVPDSDFTIGYR